MKLRNKKTGEVVVFGEGIVDLNRIGCKNVAEMYEAGWEDYEESKRTALDMIIFTLTNFIECEPDEDKVDLGDCKQMLDKLKAWKRLKDKNVFIYLDHMDFRFQEGTFKVEFPDRLLANDEMAEADRDLDLLFGGEE